MMKRQDSTMLLTAAAMAALAAAGVALVRRAARAPKALISRGDRCLKELEVRTRTLGAAGIQPTQNDPR